MDGQRFIQTVGGWIEAESLLHCQCHEHLFVADGKPAAISPALRFEEYGKSLAELLRYKAGGGSGLVDAQPIGCGRMADALQQASAQSGVHIVASTGFHKLPFYWEDHWIFTYSAERLGELFIQEIREGMFVNADRGEPKRQIGAKAGAIKTAVESGGITGRYEACFEAAAAAARLTGVPVQCHMEPGADPLQVVRFFADRGVPADSVWICHLDRTHSDRSVHAEVAQTGAYLDYDTIGRFKYHSDEQEAELIESMVASGYANRLLLSLDTTRERLYSYSGKIGLDYLLTQFIPLLRQRGMPASTIREMTVFNARKALAVRGAQSRETPA